MTKKIVLTVMQIMVLIPMVCAQQISWDVMEDNPEFSNISIKPNMVVDLGLKEGWGVGAGLMAEYRMSTIPLHFNFNFHQNLIGGDLISEEFSALRSIEFGGALALGSTQKKDVQVILKSTLVGSTSTTETYSYEYVNVQGSVQRFFLLRTGYYNHRSNWSVNDLKGEGIEINNTTVSAKGDVTANGFYLGMGLLGRRNVQIKTEEYGLSRGAGHNQLYVDFIITPAIKVGEWTDVNGSVGTAGETYDVKDDSDINLSKTGIRLGWVYNSISSTSRNPNGWFFKLESGLRPGVQGQGFFFIGSFGIAINKG